MIQTVTFIRADGEKAVLDRANGLPDLEREDIAGFLDRQGLLTSPVHITVAGDAVVVDYRPLASKP